MTVKELIDELKHYPKDMAVVLRGSNSMYVDAINSSEIDEVRAFYGNDYDAVVIYADRQIGAI